MHLILTGEFLPFPSAPKRANGVVGSEVLLQALRHPFVTRLTLLLRRPLPPHLHPSPPSPKLEVILHENFLEYPPSLLDQLQGADAVIWTIGVTGPTADAKVGKEHYRAVTLDLAVAAAKAFSGLKEKDAPDKFVFVYLSAVAAEQRQGKSWLPVMQIKGETEAALAALRPSLPIATYFFRPAPVQPVTPPHTPDPPFVAFQDVAKYFLTACCRLLITADVLAFAMLEAAMAGGSGEIAGWPGKGQPGNENTFGIDEMKALGGSSVLAQKKAA